MAAFHAGDLVLTRTEYKYLKDHPEDALAVIGVPGIVMETYRDNFEVLVDWSLLNDNHDHRGRDRWSMDDIIKVGTLKVAQYHERKIPAGQLQIGDLFTHEDKDYVVTGIQQNGYIRSKPIPSGTVRWFAPHYKVRLVKTAQKASYTEEDWRRTYSKAGGIGTAMSPTWLLNGCPICGCKIWSVTNDCWAYCDGCAKGIPTDYPFTQSGEIISKLGPEEVRSMLVRIAPAWVEDEEIWAKAKKEVDRSKYDSEDSYYAVVTTVYKNMGGKVKKKEAQSGMCYPDAFHFVLGTDEGELVHGSITNPDGAVVDHAWVEFPTGFMWEPESQSFFKMDGFYSAKKPRVDGRYTPTEASVMAVKTGHFGPWRGVRSRKAQESGEMGTILWPYERDPMVGEIVTANFLEGIQIKFEVLEVVPPGQVKVKFLEFVGPGVPPEHTGPISEAQIEKGRCPRCGEDVELGDLAPHKDERVAEMYGGYGPSPSTLRGDVCSTCRLRPWGWMLGEGRSVILKKRSSIEEIKEALEGNEIWTDQLSHGRDVVGVMDGKVWAQLPDKGLVDVTDQIDWNKLMNEMMLQEFGPGWEERLQEEFRVEGQRELSKEDRRQLYWKWLDLTDGWGSEEEHGTGPEYWREKYPFEEFLKDHLKTLEDLGVEGQVETERIKRRQRIFFRGGRTYIRTVTNIEEWALGLRGAVIIGGVKYRAFHYHGDIWTASWTRYREIEGSVPGVPEVKGQAGDVKLRQTVHKGGKKYIRTVTNIEFVERGGDLRLRGVVIIDGIKYWVVHHHGDTWTGGSRVWDLKELLPSLSGSLSPGDWDPRDLKEATTVISEEVGEPIPAICPECNYYDVEKSVDHPLIFPDKEVYCTYLIDYVIGRSECPYFTPRVKSAGQRG